MRSSRPASYLSREEDAWRPGGDLPGRAAGAGSGSSRWGIELPGSMKSCAVGPMMILPRPLAGTRAERGICDQLGT